LNLRRVFRYAAALGAVAAAGAVVIVAASFALYALAKTWLGAAGAAAVVAAVFALVAVVVAWLATRKAAPPRRKGPPADDQSLIDRLVDLAKERPLVALGATAAVVTVLIRNPAVITAVVSAFVAGNASKPEK
jgi:hypothetical protein